MKITENLLKIEKELPKIKNPLWRYLMSYIFFTFISLYEILTLLGKFIIKISLETYKILENITGKFYNAK